MHRLDLAPRAPPGGPSGRPRPARAGGRGRPRRPARGRGSRRRSAASRSEKADAAPSWKATASCSSKGIVTRPSSVPSRYSIGISSRKRSSCWARRACSSPVNGAAVNASSARAISPLRRAEARAVAGQRGPPERGEGRARLRRGAGPALARVLLGEDRPQPGGLGGELHPARVEAALVGGHRVVDELDQARLVGVEQVLLDPDRRLRAGRSAAPRGRPHRGRRVGGGRRVAGGLAEVAEQQPARGHVGTTGRDGLHRDAIGAAQQRRRGPPPRRGQRRLVPAARRRAADRSERRISAAARGSAAARPRASSPRKRRRAASAAGDRTLALGEEDRLLRVEEPLADPLGGAPRRRRRTPAAPPRRGSARATPSPAAASRRTRG